MSHLLPPFTRALLRRPAPNFAAGLTTASLGAPDYAKAMRQYAGYVQALQEAELDVTVLPADESFPDGHFVEDPLVIFRDMAFLCRSGAPARQGESQALIPHLADLRLVEPPADALIDGGDVLICADRALVGISRRTNQAGYLALRAALKSAHADIQVEAVEFSGVLHLKSGLTELAPGILLHDRKLKTAHDLSWARVITLPPEEGHAADVMPVNDRVFIAAHCPVTAELAARYCQQVVALDLSEFLKMDGGLTCLSLRY